MPSKDDLDLVAAALGLKSSVWAKSIIHLTNPEFCSNLPTSPKLDFNKLSQIKKGIIRSAAAWGYVTDNTYPREKDDLRKAGWLRAYCKDGHNIISGQWMLTDNAQRVLNGD